MEYEAPSKKFTHESRFSAEKAEATSKHPAGPLPPAMISSHKQGGRPSALSKDGFPNSHECCDPKKISFDIVPVRYAFPNT
jgi:hypothetical protein